MKYFHSILFLLFIVSSCKPILNSDHHGKVIKVKDGDSIVLLMQDNEQLEMRLAHIDAPEYSQDFGRKSKDFLSDMIAGKSIDYRVYEERDRYGRVVAELFLNDTLNINQEMVRNGYAWHFKRYSTSWTYAKLERSARREKLGLWADQHAIAPWEWRDK